MQSRWILRILRQLRKAHFHVVQIERRTSALQGSQKHLLLHLPGKDQQEDWLVSKQFKNQLLRSLLLQRARLSKRKTSCKKTHRQPLFCSKNNKNHFQRGSNSLEKEKCFRKKQRIKETIGKRRMGYLALFCCQNPYALKRNYIIRSICTYSVLPNKTDTLRRNKFTVLTNRKANLNFKSALHHACRNLSLHQFHKFFCNG